MDLSSNKATRFVYLRTLPLHSQPELSASGLVADVAARIEAATAALCDKHAASVRDHRSAVHLHTAALAIATHRVLAPRIRNDLRLDNIIRAAYGAALLPEPAAAREVPPRPAAKEKLRPDYWIVRAALWFSFDRMKAVRRMTANMVRDFGATFRTEAVDQDKDGRVQHTLLVKKCYYNTICRAEGLPHLTRVFCALDRAIYSPITKESHGIEFTLDTTLADKSEDDTDAVSACEFKFVGGPSAATT